MTQPAPRAGEGCKASATSDPPQDCDAPFCGCNPAWHDAITMLSECGWGPTDSLRTALAEIAGALGTARFTLNGLRTLYPGLQQSEACAHAIEIIDTVLTTHEAAIREGTK